METMDANNFFFVSRKENALRKNNNFLAEEKQLSSVVATRER